MSLNRVTLIGYVGHDLEELRYLPSGQPLANFSVATDENFTDKNGQKQERVDWHRVVVHGKLALICKEYLAKGRHVYVEGRLRTREYEARDNGGKRYRPRLSHSGCSSLWRDSRCRLMVMLPSPEKKEATFLSEGGWQESAAPVWAPGDEAPAIR